MRGRLERRTWTYDPHLYAPPRYRRACSYEAFVPVVLRGHDESVSADVSGVVSDAEGLIRGLNARADGALAPLARLLLRTESIASSRVEGMSANSRDLARAEARAETGGRAGPATREVLANIDAMELAVHAASSVEQIDVTSIVDIHRTLMSSAPNAAVAGIVRNEQNWVGGNQYNPCGAAFVPPPEHEVAELMNDLCVAMNDDRLAPIVQAAIVHAQFETIHPFVDGNGRTGRALIHVVLRRRGVAPTFVPPVSVVLAADRDRYVEGLTAFRDGDLDRWIGDFGSAMARAAGLAKAYLIEVDALMESWRGALRLGPNPRSDSVAWTIIDCLPAHPMITMPVAVAATGRTKAVVTQALTQLEGAGVLARVSHGDRNRVWEAEGLLDLVAGLEAGNLPPARPVD